MSSRDQDKCDVVSRVIISKRVLDGLPTGLRCLLKRSLSRRLVSAMYCLEQWLHCIIWMTFLELQSMWWVIMKKWSSQWTQFMQVRKEARKKFRTSTGFESVTSQFTGAMLYQLSYEATSLRFFMHLHKLRSLRWSFLHFHFISAVHIWFFSYIINTMW